MKLTSPFFAGLTDPRVDRNRLHEFDDIMFITVAAIICKTETWNDIEELGHSKKEWLKTFLKLENSIPSHNTFNHVFSAIDSTEFENWFIHWTSRIAGKIHQEVIAVDGKTMRGATRNKEKVHIVSGWANSNRLVLGQRKVDDKSNEITAIPKLLKSLFIEGCVVTIDTMGCQKAIAQCIVEKGADYILAVKDNQKEFYEQIQDSFKILPKQAFDQTIDMGWDTASLKSEPVTQLRTCR